MVETVKQQNHSLYRLTSGSRISVLPDASGIALYSGASGDTFFLNSSLPDDKFLNSSVQRIPKSFSAEHLRDILGLDNEALAFIVQRLLSQGVIKAVH